MIIYEFLNDVSLFLNKHNYNHIIEFRNVIFKQYESQSFYKMYFKKYRYLEELHYKNLVKQYKELNSIFQKYNYKSPKSWMYSGSLYLHSIIFEEIVTEIKNNENFKM